MSAAIVDLAAAWDAHVVAVLADRDAPEELHASDLHACNYATRQRVDGVPQLPHDDGSFANFERGHAYEARLHEAIVTYAVPRGFTVTHGGTVEYRGIVGNLDWTLERDGRKEAIIDLSTTASSSPDWKYGHTLKSAFYAMAVGADTFCEWVFCIGFGGRIVSQRAHWFALDDDFQGMTWRERVEEAITNLIAVVSSEEAVEATPPEDPLERFAPEKWRCGKVGKNGVGTSYCRARCPLNAAYTPDEVPA